MKKSLPLMILIVLIVLGGCGMNNEEENVSPSEISAEDLPDVPALQDEFTKEFIQSTEPVREGFYPFLSKSESFTMDFPEDMVISSRSHNIGPDNRSETIIISSYDDKADLFTEHSVHYYNFMTVEKNNKEAMSNSAGRVLNFVISQIKPIELLEESE